ncbi:MAG: hypothetical protein J6A28_02210 [Clostridia bacterium]|nr:hypothetical protein [Clostridia bacterium]
MNRILLFFTIFITLFCAGCGDKEFSYNRIERDAYNTGGSVSFEYDEYSHTAYFGGEDEFLEWYEIDIAKGWNEAGNRVGIKIFMPFEVDDYKSATAVVNEEKLEYDDFIVDGDNKYALFQPLVSEENNNISIKIKWEDSANEQVYNIVIRRGTNFLKGV